MRAFEILLIKSHFQRHTLLWPVKGDFWAARDKNKICLTACGCWQRRLCSWAHVGVKCRTCRSSWRIKRDGACVVQSCSHAGLRGAEETCGAVSLKVLCGGGSWGTGCVRGWSRCREDLWGCRHTAVSWQVKNKSVLKPKPLMQNEYVMRITCVQPETIIWIRNPAQNCLSTLADVKGIIFRNI